MVEKRVAIRPVILCGGAGTRLWPASREAFPKQFAALVGSRSTFQETLLRVKDEAFGRPLIVTNKAHRFLVERQMADIGVEGDVLLEPVARDSGPAILAASLFMQKNTPEALALVMAADHVVLDAPAFRAAVLEGAGAAAAAVSKGENAAAAAAARAIVVFGILPTEPATGYGYIAPSLEKIGGISRVEKFIEKPDRAQAQIYIEKGYLWNSGNFLFHPETVIEEYTNSDAESVASIRQALEEATLDLGVLILQQKYFLEAKRISFDYAVMEKTKRAALVSGSFGWSDIGGWDALWAIGEKDAAQNVARGTVRLLDSRENYAWSEDQLLTLLGVENLVVVAMRDAILVADKARVGEVKNLVDMLKKEGVPQASQHARVYRPWGWYQTLELQERFQVKRIVVYPEGKLSLQKHYHRAEHWVVVRGTARVTVDDTVKELSENQSTYIPLGAVHRLENPGKIPVEIIEVQTGAYLGEDDIVRLEDIYQRG